MAFFCFASSFMFVEKFPSFLMRSGCLWWNFYRCYFVGITMNDIFSLLFYYLFFSEKCFSHFMKIWHFEWNEKQINISFVLSEWKSDWYFKTHHWNTGSSRGFHELQLKPIKSSKMLSRVIFREYLYFESNSNLHFNFTF